MIGNAIIINTTMVNQEVRNAKGSFEWITSPDSYVMIPSGIKRIYSRVNSTPEIKNAFSERWK